LSSEGTIGLWECPKPLHEGGQGHLQNCGKPASARRQGIPPEQPGIPPRGGDGDETPAPTPRPRVLSPSPQPQPVKTTPSTSVKGKTHESCQSCKSRIFDKPIHHLLRLFLRQRRMALTTIWLRSLSETLRSIRTVTRLRPDSRARTFADAAHRHRGGVQRPGGQLGPRRCDRRGWTGSPSGW